MITYLNKKGWVINFSCAHFYHNPDWEPTQNKEVFGLCNQQPGHGHDYQLEFLMNAEHPDILRAKNGLHKLKEQLDHQHLNSLPAFQKNIPTTEGLALYIGDYFKQLLGPQTFEFKLYETAQIWVEYKS